MIGDIALGQYYPGDSLVHRLDPRVKILLTIVYMVALFLAVNAWSLLCSAALLTTVTLLSRVPFRMVAQSLRPLWPIILLMTVINVFYGDGGVTLVHYGFLTITSKGVILAVFMTVRILFLIVCASMLTCTTTPIALTDALESLLSPLNRLHLPVHELSMMMTIALRFIPTLMEETDRIISAQKARGADFESGNLMRRLHALVPILVPLFVSAYRRAWDLALAMDCRCYHGGKGRTRLHQLKIAGRDIAASLLGVGGLLLVVLLNRLFGALI